MTEAFLHHEAAFLIHCTLFFFSTPLLQAQESGGESGSDGALSVQALPLPLAWGEAWELL